MATTAKKATPTNVCCTAFAGVRREAASASASAVDWSVPSVTAEDQRDKKASTMAPSKNYYRLASKYLAHMCTKRRQGVKESLGTSENLSFAEWKMDGDSIMRLVMLANGLKELDV